MKAVATTAGRGEGASRRSREATRLTGVSNARRRRLVTGGVLATLILTALGLSLAAAEPSLKDQIDSAQGQAGELSNRIDAQTSRIASLTTQARQAGTRAMVLNAQVERAEDRSRELGGQLTDAQQQLDRARAEYADAV